MSSIDMPGSGGRNRGLLNWATPVVALLLLMLTGTSLGAGQSVAASDASGARTHVVEIRQFKFFPESLRVNAGDTIIWKNLDAAPHTATAQAWDSGRLNRNQSWSLRVTGKGTIEYICTYHPAMKGQIVVAGGLRRQQ